MRRLDLGRPGCKRDRCPQALFLVRAPSKYRCHQTQVVIGDRYSHSTTSARKARRMTLS